MKISHAESQVEFNISTFQQHGTKIMEIHRELILILYH